MSVRLAVHDRPLARRELDALLGAVCVAVGARPGSVGLRLVGDSEMTRLNMLFAGLPGPTNVLAFPAETESASEDDESGHIGEIALNVDAVEREAFLYDQPEGEYLLRLVVHAALHLAGHDHGEVMDALTDAVVAELADRL